MHHCIRLAAVATLVLSTTAAQGRETLPFGRVMTEGKSSRHVPLRHVPARIQCGYSASATAWTTARVVTTLTVRADSAADLATGFRAEMQVWLSSDNCDTRTTSSKFMANHGRDVVVFMRRRAYSFASFARVSGRRNFDIVLKGDSPFVARKPTLLVDWATYATSNQVHSNFYVDAALSSGFYRAYGTACNSTSFDSYAAGFNVGNTFTTYCYTRNAGDVVTMWLSPKKVSTSLGGGCTVYADPFAPGSVVFPAPILTTAASGYANFVWGTVPAILRDTTLFGQAFALDGRGSPRWSRGSEITFGAANVTSHRYNYGVGSRSFDPDRDDGRYGWADTAIIFKVN